MKIWHAKVFVFVLWFFLLCGAVLREDSFPPVESIAANCILVTSIFWVCCFFLSCIFYYFPPRIFTAICGHNRKIYWKQGDIFTLNFECKNMVLGQILFCGTELSQDYAVCAFYKKRNELNLESKVFSVDRQECFSILRLKTKELDLGHWRIVGNQALAIPVRIGGFNDFSNSEVHSLPEIEIMQFVSEYLGITEESLKNWKYRHYLLSTKQTMISSDSFGIQQLGRMG